MTTSPIKKRQRTENHESGKTTEDLYNLYIDTKDILIVRAIKSAVDVIALWEQKGWVKHEECGNNMTSGFVMQKESDVKYTEEERLNIGRFWKSEITPKIDIVKIQGGKNVLHQVYVNVHTLIGVPCNLITPQVYNCRGNTPFPGVDDGKVKTWCCSLGVWYKFHDDVFRWNELGVDKDLLNVTYETMVKPWKMYYYDL